MLLTGERGGPCALGNVLSVQGFGRQEESKVALEAQNSWMHLLLDFPRPFPGKTSWGRDQESQQVSLPPREKGVFSTSDQGPVVLVSTEGGEAVFCFFSEATAHWLDDLGCFMEPPLPHLLHVGHGSVYCTARLEGSNEL